VVGLSFVMLGNGAVPKQCFVDSVEVLVAFFPPQVVHHREFQQCQELKGWKFQGNNKSDSFDFREGNVVFSTGESIYYIKESQRLELRNQTRVIPYQSTTTKAISPLPPSSISIQTK
jgi:hypothetical protein